RPMTFKGAL
nr:Chain C, RFL9 peptide [synthetic construct]